MFIPFVSGLLLFSAGASAFNVHRSGLYARQDGELGKPAPPGRCKEKYPIGCKYPPYAEPACVPENPCAFKCKKGFRPFPLKHPLRCVPTIYRIEDEDLQKRSLVVRDDKDDKRHGKDYDKDKDHDRKKKKDKHGHKDKHRKHDKGHGRKHDKDYGKKHDKDHDKHDKDHKEYRRDPSAYNYKHDHVRQGYGKGHGGHHKPGHKGGYRKKFKY